MRCSALPLRSARRNARNLLESSQALPSVLNCRRLRVDLGTRDLRLHRGKIRCIEAEVLRLARLQYASPNAGS